MRRAYVEADYPHGCRCSCCSHLFEPGDVIVDREVATDWSTPTCEQCDAFDVQLVPGHPFGPGKTPTACADGMVR